jgi:MFS family permease
LASGLIVQHAGWRWVFLSVPAIVLGAAAMVLPALRDIGALPAGRDAGRDRRRTAWSIGAAFSVLLLHVAGQRTDAAAWPLLAVAVGLLLVCARQLLPVGTLRVVRGLPAVIALRSIAAAAFFGTEVFLPLLLSRERGLSPTLAGLVLTLGALGWSAGSWYRGRMRDPAPVPLLRAGLGLIAIGVFAVASAVWPATPTALAMSGWTLAGLGMGLVFPTLSVLALQLSPPELQGSHSSALQLAGSLFTAAVLTLGGALFAALLTRVPSAAYLAGFAITAGLAVLGLLLVARVRAT